ncbi:MAG: DUF268 domain-containing protein [Candidatus Lindowbacteria bacterium]|nr:DUF268 domain-containing protein [Candidatus Lindowbacteria bacterium]
MHGNHLRKSFDFVISISTIEHVGLGTCGDPHHDDGDSIAINKLKEALKKGGGLYY